MVAEIIVALVIIFVAIFVYDMAAMLVMGLVGLIWKRKG
jgi:hypothetical protein